MVVKLKAKFIPNDYHLNLFIKLQNLRQKGLSVKEYTEEFYKLNIRAGHRENDEEKIDRYINGLRYEIHDDIIVMKMRNIEDSYQVALKEEEKLARTKIQQNRGKSPNRGRGTIKEKFQKSRGEAGRYSSQKERGGSSRGGHYGGINYFPRGRGRGIGGEVKCYSHGKTWHMSWECLEKQNAGGREAHIYEEWKKNVETEMKA
jgi:hypothetical protein